VESVAVSPDHFSILNFTKNTNAPISGLRSALRSEAMGAEVLQYDVPIQVIRLTIKVEIEEAGGGPREGVHTVEVLLIHDLVEIAVPRTRRLGVEDLVHLVVQLVEDWLQ